MSLVKVISIQFFFFFFRCSVSFGFIRKYEGIRVIFLPWMKDIGARLVLGLADHWENWFGGGFSELEPLTGSLILSSLREWGRPWHFGVVAHHFQGQNLTSARYPQLLTPVMTAFRSLTV